MCAKLEDVPAEYLQKVKDVHEKGGFGSQGLVLFL